MNSSISLLRNWELRNCTSHHESSHGGPYKFSERVIGELKTEELCIPK